MNNQYVVLTGAKNNAGDFLIKDRIQSLLAAERPDRELINFDAWKPLSDEQLKIVNKSKAILLAGGPALHQNMWPVIYPLVNDLAKITVPIIMMGIGWKSLEGTWGATYNYSLSERTLQLLKKIEKSGFLSSVRDYHTLNVLLNHGFKNLVMTGCPALYSLKHIRQNTPSPEKKKNISFSLGVSFVESESMKKQMKETILRLKDFFSEEKFQVVFHHTLNREIYIKSYSGAYLNFFDRHEQMRNWLISKNVDCVDISGSLENMLNHYSDCDLHIGYRVHAHILMSSVSKLSVLLNEDGRGKALKDVIGGLIFDAFERVNKKSFIQKILNKIKPGFFDPMDADMNLSQNLIQNLEYEKINHLPRFLQARNNIDTLFTQMERFIKQLP